MQKHKADDSLLRTSVCKGKGQKVRRCTFLKMFEVVGSDVWSKTRLYVKEIVLKVCKAVDEMAMVYGFSVTKNMKTKNN